METGCVWRMMTITCITAIAVPLKSQFNTWVERQQMPTPRTAETTAVLDGRIYVCGGLTSRTSPALDVIEAYDPVSDTWDTTISAMPAGLSAAGAETINGRLYVYGGRAGYPLSAAEYKTVYAYDPQMNEWTHVGDMPIINYGMGSVVIDSVIHSMGGASNLGPPLNITAHNTYLTYDAATNTWSTQQGINPPRAFGFAVIANDLIYLLGGSNQGALSDRAQVYDPVNMGWSNLASMPEPLYTFGAAAIEGKIYVLPGSATNPITVFSEEVYVYDIPGDTWTTHEQQFPNHVNSYAVEVVKDKDNVECMYVIGGAHIDFWTDNGGPLVSGSVWRFCPQEVVGTANEIDHSPMDLQVMPNPAWDRTVILYHVPAKGRVHLSICDQNGRQLDVLDDDIMTAGEHEVEYDLFTLSPGLYVCRLAWNDRIATQTIIKE